jgi:hypothetical protein
MLTCQEVVKATAREMKTVPRDISFFWVKSGERYWRDTASRDNRRDRKWHDKLHDKLTPNGTCNMSAIHTLPTANRSLVEMRTVLRF